MSLSPTSPGAPLHFKFKWVDGEGDETGFRAKSGYFDGHILNLDEEDIPAENLVQAVEHSGRLILLYKCGEDLMQGIIAVKKINALDLRNLINSIASYHSAEEKKKELAAKGQSTDLILLPCPHCASNLDLTGFNSTEQLYCRYCETIFKSTNLQPDPEEPCHTVCDSCGQFSRPRTLYVFNFYFLLVVYGYSFSKRQMCGGCMRGEAWKMLFINLIFILGVPNALIQLCRAYFGKTDNSMKGLDTGNAAAKGGRWDKALDLYMEINQLLGEHGHAGVYYNMGRVFHEKAELDQAIKAFEHSLGACSNYHPSYAYLRELLKQSGRIDEALALDTLFGEEEVIPEETGPPSLPAG